MREPSDAVLALGVNLGDRQATLHTALAELNATQGVAVQRISPYVETAPVGGPEQPDYLNAVALVRTTLSPLDLLAACHEIEQAHGRERTVRWGPRTLDVDLISYGTPGTPDETLSDDPELTLPHPRAHERAFVLVPWAAADPQARLRLRSGELRDVADLAELAPDRAGVRPW